MENTHIEVCNHLGINKNSQLAKSNYMTQAVSGHTQQLAGMQGGTLGSHSLKVSRGNGISSEQKEILGIINQKSAYGNSKIEILDNKQQADKLRSDFNDSKQKYDLGLDKERKEQKVQKVAKEINKTLEKFKEKAIISPKQQTVTTGMNPKAFEKNKSTQRSV